MLLQLIVYIGLLVVAAPRSSVIEKRYPDGSLRQQREVRIDERGQEIDHGKLTKYYPDGKPSAETHYVNGIRDGAWTTWHASGTKSGEGTYRKDMKSGLETRYLPAGSKYLETNYRDGSRHGTDDARRSRLPSRQDATWHRRFWSTIFRSA